VGGGRGVKVPPPVLSPSQAAILFSLFTLTSALDRATMPAPGRVRSVLFLIKNARYHDAWLKIAVKPKKPMAPLLKKTAFCFLVFVNDFIARYFGAPLKVPAGLGRPLLECRYTGSNLPLTCETR